MWDEETRRWFIRGEHPSERLWVRPVITKSCAQAGADRYPPAAHCPGTTGRHPSESIVHPLRVNELHRGPESSTEVQRVPTGSFRPVRVTGRTAHTPDLEGEKEWWIGSMTVPAARHELPEGGNRRAMPPGTPSPQRSAHSIFQTTRVITWRHRSASSGHLRRKLMQVVTRARRSDSFVSHITPTRLSRSPRFDTSL